MSLSLGLKVSTSTDNLTFWQFMVPKGQIWLVQPDSSSSLRLNFVVLSLQQLQYMIDRHEPITHSCLLQEDLCVRAGISFAAIWVQRLGAAEASAVVFVAPAMDLPSKRSPDCANVELPKRRLGV